MSQFPTPNVDPIYNAIDSAPKTPVVPAQPSIDKISTDYISQVQRDGTISPDLLKDPAFQSVISSMPKPVSYGWQATYSQLGNITPAVNYIPPATFTPLSPRTTPVGVEAVFAAAFNTNITSRIIDLTQEAYASVGDNQVIDLPAYFASQEKELKSTPAGQYVWYNQYLQGNYDSITSPNRLLATIANDMARFGYMQTLSTTQGPIEHVSAFAGNAFDTIPLVVSLGAAALVTKLAGAGALTAEEIASINEAQTVVNSLKGIARADLSAEQISALSAARKTISGSRLTSNVLNTTIDNVAGTQAVTSGTKQLTNLGSFLQTEAGFAAWWATGEPVLQSQEPNRTAGDALKSLGENLAVGAVLYGAGKLIGLGISKAREYLITKTEVSADVAKVEAPPEVVQQIDSGTAPEFKTDAEKFIDEVAARRPVEPAPAEPAPVAPPTTEITIPRQVTPGEAAPTRLSLDEAINEYKRSIEEYIRQLSDEPQHTTLISDLNELLISIDRAEARGHLPEEGHDLLNIIKELSDNATQQTTRLEGSEVPTLELQALIRRAQDKIKDFHDIFEQRLTELSGSNPVNADLVLIRDQLPDMIRALRTRLVNFSDDARVSMKFSNMSEAVDTFLSDHLHGFDFNNPELSLKKLNDALASFGSDIHINDAKNITPNSTRQRILQNRINLGIQDFRAIVEQFQAEVTDAVNAAAAPPAPGLSTEVLPPATTEVAPSGPVEHVNAEPVDIAAQQAEQARLDANQASLLAQVEEQLGAGDKVEPITNVEDLKKAVEQLAISAQQSAKSIKGVTWKVPLIFSGILGINGYFRLYHKIKALGNKITAAAGNNNSTIDLNANAYVTVFDNSVSWLQDPKTVARFKSILENGPQSSDIKKHLAGLDKIADTPEARGEWSSQALDLLLSFARDQEIQNKNLSVASNLVIKSAANAYSNILGNLYSIGRTTAIVSQNVKGAAENYKLISDAINETLAYQSVLKVKDFDSYIKNFVNEVANRIANKTDYTAETIATLGLNRFGINIQHFYLNGLLPNDEVTQRQKSLEAALMWAKIANQSFRQLSDVADASVSGVNGKGSDYLAQISVIVIGNALKDVLAEGSTGHFDTSKLNSKMIENIINNSPAKDIINNNLIDRANSATSDSIDPKLSIYFPSDAKDLLVYVGLNAELKAKGTLNKDDYDALWKTLPMSDTLAFGKIDAILAGGDRKSTDYYNVVGKFLNDSQLPVQNSPQKNVITSKNATIDNKPLLEQIVPIQPKSILKPINQENK